MSNPMFDSRQSNAPAQGGGIFGAMFNRLYQSNPAFRDFANQMKGLNEAEMCQKCGVDPSQLAEAKKDPGKFLSEKGMI